MFRNIISGGCNLLLASFKVKQFTNNILPKINNSFITQSSIKPLSSVQLFDKHWNINGINNRNNNLLIPSNFNAQQERSVIKFSMQKGKRKTVKCVLKRFYRLDWGIWIRTRCGRHKRLHTKSKNRKRRLKQHVFTNATQSYLLDKMVSKFWRKPKFYVDDPYEPYHTREEFPYTRKKPYVPLD